MRSTRLFSIVFSVLPAVVLSATISKRQDEVRGDWNPKFYPYQDENCSQRVYFKADKCANKDKLIPFLFTKNVDPSKRITLANDFTNDNRASGVRRADDHFWTLCVQRPGQPIFDGSVFLMSEDDRVDGNVEAAKQHEHIRIKWVGEPKNIHMAWINEYHQGQKLKSAAELTNVRWASGNEGEHLTPSMPSGHQHKIFGHWNDDALVVEYCGSKKPYDTNRPWP